MAKRKVGRPKTSERNDVSVKIDKTLVGKAKLIATYQGKTMAELFSEILEGPIDRYYGKMVAELGEKGGGK
jgi:hypothetical protein